MTTAPANTPTEHITIDPPILYVGTPVALVTTLNADGSVNIGPISSAWALGHTVVLGWATSSQTLRNLERERECTIGFPDPTLVDEVERLAPLTGRNPLPAHKQGVFRYEPRKFEAAGLAPAPSETVRPPLIAECPLSFEARVTAVHRPATPDADDFRIVETYVERVQASPVIVKDGRHIDTERWSPLLYVFRHYFGTGPDLGATFRAES